MAKISALTAAASFLDADEFGVNEAGVSKKVSGTVLKAWAGNVLNNYSGSVQTPAAATRTYIAGSSISVPVGKLRIGTFFQWRFNMTKTAAGSATSVIDVAIGTAGTTADTARLSFTKPAGTAAAAEGWVTVDALCLGPLSAAGVFSGEFTMLNGAGTTGHLTASAAVVNNTSAAFDVTTASLIVGLCITTGAADAITIRHVTAQAFNL